MRRRGLKQPVDLPLWIADLRLVKLTKHGFARGQENHKSKNQEGNKAAYWGPGLPVYVYNLRTERGRTISKEYIRARNPRDAIKRIREYWPSVQGIKSI